MNVYLLEDVEGTTKKNFKVELLKKADNDLRAFISEALDQDITYGITADEDAYVYQKQGINMSSDKFWKHLQVFLGMCANRKLTGNAALHEMNKLLAQAPDAVSLKWAIRFINRNLRAGFDMRTANKAWGKGSITKFEVQLAQAYEGEPLEGWWFFQPKLDGNRVVMIDGKAMSRGGKEYKACQHIIDEFLKSDKDFFKKWVVDGEMMGNLGFDKSSGALRRLNQDLRGNKQKAEFVYWVFDLIPRAEWERRDSAPLYYRMTNMESHIIGYKNIKLVPSEKLQDPSHKQIMALMEKYLKQGFEGAMAKDANASYKWGRGDNILKVKKFYDGDYTVVDMYEGKGKHKGRLGGLIVENKKTYSKVGSGFDDDLRDLIWKNKKDWTGAVVQVQYQEETKDGSLRFPVFIMRRKDKE